MTSNILATLGSLTIVSAVVSALVQWLKQYTLGGNRAIVVLAFVSMVVGTGYFFFQQLPNWKVWLADVMTILAYANAIYTLFIQWFENKPTQ